MRTAARLLQRVLAGIGALYLIVTFTPLDNWWTNRLCGPIGDPKGDVLILLGAEAFPDAIGYESYLRAVYGVRVWRQGGFRQIFISGGRGPNGMPVSVPMRDFMVAEGVPASVITVETVSTSTHENALYTKQALGNTPGRMVLLTSDYHTFRAWHAFRKVGLDVEECSFPDYYKQIGMRSMRWGAFLGLCRETTAIAYYWVRGWI
jgi:uncharacterized SAM-binding protein YcdF (DUF218 family)